MPGDDLTIQAQANKKKAGDDLIIQAQQASLNNSLRSQAKPKITANQTVPTGKPKITGENQPTPNNDNSQNQQQQAGGKQLDWGTLFGGWVDGFGSMVADIFKNKVLKAGAVKDSVKLARTAAKIMGTVGIFTSAGVSSILLHAISKLLIKQSWHDSLSKGAKALSNIAKHPADSTDIASTAIKAGSAWLANKGVHVVKDVVKAGVGVALTAVSVGFWKTARKMALNGLSFENTRGGSKSSTALSEIARNPVAHKNSVESFISDSVKETMAAKFSGLRKKFASMSDNGNLVPQEHSQAVTPQAVNQQNHAASLNDLTPQNNTNEVTQQNHNKNNSKATVSPD